MISAHIEIPEDKLIAFCERYPIHKLSLFGSVLHEGFKPNSDVDVLVEYEPDARVTYLDMAQHEMELSAIFGRRVDLREPEELSPYFRHNVLEIAVPLYERAG